MASGAGVVHGAHLNAKTLVHGIAPKGTRSASSSDSSRASSSTSGFIDFGEGEGDRARPRFSFG